MKIVIQGTLPTLNKYINAERSNRYIAAKVKKEATEFVWWQLKGLQPIKGLNDYTFTWYVPNKRTDPDNIAFGVKFFFDALVGVKLIPNDNMSYIGSLTHHFKIGSPKVEVKIETSKQETS